MKALIKKWLIGIGILAGSVLAPVALSAQVPSGWDGAQFQMTREDLRQLLSRYESVISSPGYSDALKEDARDAVALIRARLEEGDFKVGDRIVVRLEGSQAGLLPDTLVVGGGPALDIPDMGVISLKGVLRSELEEHLQEELARYLRNPTLTAESLIRLSIQGSVGRPGFYVFPSQMLLSDVMMQAQGPTQQADLDDIRIRRGEELLMDGSEVQEALDEGWSLDQLGLQAGDEVTIPQQPQQSWWPQIARWGVTIAVTLILGVRIF